MRTRLTGLTVLFAVACASCSSTGGAPTSAAGTVTVTESAAATAGATATVTETAFSPSGGEAPVTVTVTASAGQAETSEVTTEDSTVEQSDTAKLGGPGYTWEDGLKVEISAPAPFSPSDTAAGTEKFSEYVQFNVTITNGTKQKYDPSLFSMTIQTGDEEAEAVFDSAEGFNGPPSTSVLSGRSSKFKLAFGVKDPKDLVAEVSPGFEYEAAIFTT